MKRTKDGWVEFTFVENLNELFCFISVKKIQNQLLKEIENSNDKESEDILLHSVYAALEETSHQKSGKYYKWDAEIKKRYFNHNKEILRNWTFIVATLAIIVNVIIKFM